MAELQLLTNSARNCYGECHRKYFYRYVMGYKPAKENENLRFGSLVHACLEHWLLQHHEGPEARMRVVHHYLDERLRVGDDAFEIAKARVMMDGYEARWGDVPMTVHSVEEEFEAPLFNPDTNGTSRTWALGGKMDGIVSFDDPMRQVLEHKTTSLDIAADAKYWTKLAIDGQVSQYYVGGASRGHDIGGTTYDVLRKPGSRPQQIPRVDENGIKIVLDANGERVMNKDGKTFRQTASTADGFVLQTRPETAEEYETRIRGEIFADLDKYFRRLPVPRLEQDLAEYLSDMWAVGREIAEAKNNNRWPKNPRSCDNYGTCEFFDVCAGRESLDNPHVFRRARANEELSAPAVEAF